MHRFTIAALIVLAAVGLAISALNHSAGAQDEPEAADHNPQTGPADSLQEAVELVERAEALLREARSLLERARESNATESTVTRYTVRAGDSLASISRQFFGTHRKWKAIKDANPDVDFLRLRVGEVLVIPSE